MNSCDSYIEDGSYSRNLTKEQQKNNNRFCDQVKTLIRKDLNSVLLGMGIFSLVFTSGALAVYDHFSSDIDRQFSKISQNTLGSSDKLTIIKK